MAKRRNFFRSEQTVWCMYVWGCMKFLSTESRKTLVELEVFGSWQIHLLTTH